MVRCNSWWLLQTADYDLPNECLPVWCFRAVGALGVAICKRKERYYLLTPKLRPLRRNTRWRGDSRIWLRLCAAEIRTFLQYMLPLDFATRAGVAAGADIRPFGRACV